MSLSGRGIQTKKYAASQSRGASTLTWFIFTLVLGGIVYLLSKILPIYYSYFELENQMRSLIRVADENTDDQIRKKLKYQLKQLDIPATIDEVSIKRSSRTMVIELHYSDWLDIPLGATDYELWEFEFHLKVEDKIP